MALRIIIVEDEPTIALQISFILKDYNHVVLGIAHSSEKALDLLYAEVPDIILLDIAIKGTRNGIELAEIIKEKYGIPFIFITSFSDKDTMAQIAETIPYGYILKPFKDEDIQPAILLAMSKYEASKSGTTLSIDHINKKLRNPLTKSEFKVVSFILEGLKNNEIAESMFLSPNTIKTHIKNICVKLEVNSKHMIMAKLNDIKQN